MNILKGKSIFLQSTGTPMLDGGAQTIKHYFFPQQNRKPTVTQKITGILIYLSYSCELVPA